VSGLVDRSLIALSHERALASTLFSLAPFLGPVCGPIVGGFIVEKYGFRWVFWVQFIFAA
jgi:MFS family permease